MFQCEENFIKIVKMSPVNHKLAGAPFQFQGVVSGCGQMLYVAPYYTAMNMANYILIIAV